MVENRKQERTTNSQNIYHKADELTLILYILFMQNLFLTRLRGLQANSITKTKHKMMYQWRGLL